MAQGILEYGARVRKMSIDSQMVFWAVQCAYRNGVLDKISALQGEALKAIMRETGLNMGDLFNRLDEAQEETVQKIDRLAGRLGPLIKYANNDRLMKLVSRILDIRAVQRIIVKGSKKMILKNLDGRAAPSPMHKPNAMAAE